MIPEQNDYTKKISQINLTEKNENKNNILFEDWKIFKNRLKIYNQKMKSDNNNTTMGKNFFSINTNKKNIIPTDDNKKMIKNYNDQIKNISNRKSVGLIVPKRYKFIKYNFSPVNNIIINMKRRENSNLQTTSPNNSKLKVYHKKTKNNIKTNNSFNIGNSNLKVIEDNPSKLIFNKINNFKNGENNNNLNRTIKEDRNSFNKSYQSSFICLYKDRMCDFNRRLLKKNQNNRDFSGDAYTHSKFSRFNTLLKYKSKKNVLLSTNSRKNFINKICYYNSPINGDN